MTFKPDYLCHPQCVAQDALAEQIEARKEDADEILALKTALKNIQPALELAEKAAHLLLRTGAIQQKYRDRALTMLDRARACRSVIAPAPGMATLSFRNDAWSRRGGS